MTQKGATTPPKETPVAVVKLVPVMVAEVPAKVVTVTWMVPEACGGATAVMDVDELTVKLAAAVVPKLTAVAPVKLVPVMATEAPPPVVPLVVPRPVTVGADAALTVN